jgi:hypothetical protein
MVARRRTPRSAVLAVLAATLCASLTGAVSPGNAQEAAPATGAPAADIATVEAQLVQLRAQELEAAARAEQLTATVAEAQARLATAQRGLAATRARLASAREQAARLAAAAYRKGSLDPSMLPVALALSDDPTATLRGTSYLAAVLAQQDSVLRRVQRAAGELRADEGMLAKRTDALSAQQDQLAAQHETVRKSAADAAALLGTLQEQERARLEAARRAETERASRGAARTAAAAPPGTSAPPIDTGSCAPSGSRGAEARLTPATLAIMRCGLSTFPQIEYAGGWGTRGNATDHDDGRAVDFMIPDYRSGAGNDLGWAVAEWASNQPGVDYVMFDRRIFGSWAPEDGWTSVGDRGSDTANHRDHVHVSVKG